MWRIRRLVLTSGGILVYSAYGLPGGCVYSMSKWWTHMQKRMHGRNHIKSLNIICSTRKDSYYSDTFGYLHACVSMNLFQDFSLLV